MTNKWLLNKVDLLRFTVFVVEATNVDKDIQHKIPVCYAALNNN